MFKHYIACATFIFLCIFLVQIVVTEEWVRPDYPDDFKMGHAV